MSVSRSTVITARILVFTLCLGVIAPLGFAQNQQTPNPSLPESPKPAPNQAPVNGGVMREDYGAPKSHLWNPISPYTARHVAPPNFANTSRIDQIMHDGKIYLSMGDAIALALENNLDIAIARYNLPIADTDVMLSKSGQSTRGVNAGVVQNTPGGTGVGITSGAAGAGAGGTTGGSGGAGAGTAGLVTSTAGVGSPIGSYDPIITATSQVERSSSPTAFPFLYGTNTLHSNTTMANFAYNQSWQTGTTANLTFNNDRITSGFQAYSPQLDSNFRLTLSQHLLQGFGFLPNQRFIRIAKNDRKITDSAFRQQVRETVSTIQNIYWDLVAAYEDVKVKQRALEFAQRTYSDNQKQVQIGTLAPIEVVHAQSQVSTAQQDLIVSQTNLQSQELLMKNAITRNLGDPMLATAEVIPTDTMRVDDTDQLPQVNDLIKTAQDNSPEIEQAKIDLTNRDITKKSARNALLPTLDAYAFYGASSLKGVVNPSLYGCNPDPILGNCPGTTGYDNALGSLVNSSNPDKGVGINLTIPIRNRAAQANQVRSELEYRQAEMRLQQLYNTVNIQVRNAAFAVQQDTARVKAAQAAREYALQSLDAEQKKYSLGASTSTLVLQNQSAFETSEGQLISALTAYEKHKVELDRVTSQTLTKNHIELGDSIKGVVNTMPQVPGVIKITSDVNNPANEPVHKQPQTQPQPEPLPQQPQQPQQ